MMNKNPERSSSIDSDQQEPMEPAGESASESTPDAATQDGESGERSSPDPKQLEQIATAKTEEARVLHDKYLRLAAEFENYKRLVQRDQREQAKFANETLLKELLPIVDNLERAVKFSKDGSGDGLIQGVELTLKQFVETLGRFGVRPISSVGERFDPSRHQAVANVVSEDVSERTVVEEHQKGYFLHDRILRAAMVSVAAPPDSPESVSEAPSEVE
jgi:molecular chaperone GrpE